MNAQEIRDLFQRHKVTLSRDDVWDVKREGASIPVVKHKALEKLSAALQVEWGPPQIVRAERDEAVLIATGKLPESLPEWSIGEAVINQNYKVTGKMQPYPYAMAEKRAKDRVILKLAGLHGAYSEEEADDFRQGTKTEESQPTETGPSLIKGLSSKDIYIENSLNRIATFEFASDLLNWAKTERQKVWPQYKIQAEDEDGQRIVTAFKHRMEQLSGEMQE